MFYNEQGVPHFHAVYGEHEATIEIDSERVHGFLPSRALKLPLNGTASIDQNCSRTGDALAGEPLVRIPPLE